MLHTLAASRAVVFPRFFSRLFCFFLATFWVFLTTSASAEATRAFSAANGSFDIPDHPQRIIGAGCFAEHD